jgi:hypothetical protein
MALYTATSGFACSARDRSGAAMDGFGVSVPSPDQTSMTLRLRTFTPSRIQLLNCQPYSMDTFISAMLRPAHPQRILIELVEKDHIVEILLAMYRLDPRSIDKVQGWPFLLYALTTTTMASATAFPYDPYQTTANSPWYHFLAV